MLHSILLQCSPYHALHFRLVAVHLLVVLFEVLFDCVHVALTHGVSVNDLLTLHLVVDLRKVLRELVVQRRTEADDRFWAKMANVDANKHGVLVRELWKSQVIKISSRLGIDLPQNCRG